MTTATAIPPGPSEPYRTSQELIEWMVDSSRRYGDLYRASVYGTNVYVVNSPEYAQHVLRRNWRNYRKGQAIKRIAMLLGNGLMVSEGELWKTQRRMIQPAFHRTAIDGLGPVIATANAALLDKWEAAARAGTSVNVTRDISLMVLEVVLRALFGDDYDEVAPQFNIVSDETGRNLEFAQAFAALRRCVIALATRRRGGARTYTDMLGMLMAARDDDGRPMSDAQLANEVVTIVVAGHETTASTLNLTWYLLSQNPKVEASLLAELQRLPWGDAPRLDDLPKYAYVRKVLEEALRLYPAGWLLTRRAIRDDRLGDYHVPAGTEIYISPYIIQRNPDLWAEPGRFDPDRFEAGDLTDKRSLATLPFSVGPRNCIGEYFARIEMQIHLMIIARRLRMTYVEAAPPEFEAGVNLRSKVDFVMTPEFHSPPARGGSVT